MPASTQAVGAAPSASSSQFQTGDVVAISAGHAVHDIYTAFLPPLLPKFIAALGLSRTEAGVLSLFMQAPSLLQPVIGHAADRAGLRYMVILGPSIAAAGMCLLGVAPTYGVLALLLLFVGVGSAGMHTVGPVMAGAVSGRRLGRAMSFWMVGGELARSLGPLLIVTVVEAFSLQAMPWLMVGGFAASALLYVRLRDVPAHVPGTPREAVPWRPALRRMAPLMVPLAGLILARAFMVSALTTYLPLFLSEEGTGLWLAGASLSLLQGAGVVGALLGGSLSDRLGRRMVLLLSFLLTPALMFAFLGTHGSLRIFLLVPMGLTGLSVAPVVMALVQETYPESRALANGVYMGLSFLIRSGAVVALGAIGDLAGMRLAFLVSAAMPLLGLPLLWLLPGGGAARQRA